MFKVNNKDTRKRRSGVFNVNLNIYITPCSSVSIANFEQVNAGRKRSIYMQVIFSTVQVAYRTEFTYKFFFFFRDEYMVAMVSLSCFFLCFNQFFNHLDIELFSGIIMELCMVANKWIIKVDLFNFNQVSDDLPV